MKQMTIGGVNMFKNMASLVLESETISHIGKIENIVGMGIEASGGKASMGDISLIYNEGSNKQIPAEIVGFRSEERRVGKECVSV